MSCVIFINGHHCSCIYYIDLNHQLIVKRINTFVEKALKEVPKELANTACKTYFQTPCRVYHPPANLLASKRSSISSLRSDKTTTILPADREVNVMINISDIDYTETINTVW